MTVLPATLDITAVVFKGLDNLTLPFVSHLVEGVDDSEFSRFTAENTDRYFVKSITGLEPPDRTVALASTASGGKYQGNTVADREVVVLIGLNPDYSKGETPQFLRNQLYTMINTGYDPKVDIQLYSMIFPICHEFAYVTKFEEDLFSANPVVQITFTCLNPTFKAFGIDTYSSGSLSEKNPNVYNRGTAETGFQFAVKFTADMDGWFIKQSEHQAIGMIFDKTFHDGDILSVSTIPGQRYVHLKKHRGKVENRLDILKGESEWIQLHPGNNHFVVPKKVGKWDWKGKLAYRAQFWGV